MRILIDIGHPAHVHYFKNFIKIMESKGHVFSIVARDKDVTHKLLKSYNIGYTSRGVGKNSLFGKIIYSFKANNILFRIAKRWKPDIFLSFASPYAGLVSKLVNKHHIALTDTEHARLGILAFEPVTNVIITPESFKGDFSKKHIRIKGFFELCYLLPKYFKEDDYIKKLDLFDSGLKVVMFRFISWNASHDIGQSGLSIDDKKKLINLLENRGFKILISSEGEVPNKFKQYQVNFSPDKIHSVISRLDLFIGESGTMATEAAILGVPSVLINSLDAGVFQEEVKYGILYSYRSSEGIVKIVNDLVDIENLKELHRNRVKKMLNDKIDVTAFLVWFVLNYPESLNNYNSIDF